MSTTTGPGTFPTTSAQPTTIPISSPAKFVRIIHHPAPDLTYAVQIRDRPGPLHDPQSAPPVSTTHDLAQERTLFSFPNSTFSFANFGPFSDFLASHTAADIACITSVQWEAHGPWDVAGGSTLTVAKMLVDRLPGLKEVVLLQVMRRRDSQAVVVKHNLKEWRDGLRNLKVGLEVVVRRMEPGRFKVCTGGGSFRSVDPTGGRISRRKAVGRWGMDER